MGKADIVFSNIRKVLSGKMINGITLFTAPACNLNCLYCFSGKRRETGAHIRFSKWRSIIYQAKEMGAQWVIFAGPGEPLLGDINLNLIDYANSLAMRSVIFTNGVLVRKDIAKFLRAKNVYATIKVHSFNPVIYDFLAGKSRATEWADYSYLYNGQYLKHSIPLGLKILLDETEGFSLRKRKAFLRIESVVTKHNLSCLIDIARFTRANNLDFLLETLITMNDNNISNLVPEDKEYLCLFSELSKILGWKFTFSQRIPSCDIRKNPVIWENGDIAFCFVEKANIGNLYANTLRELWAMRLRIKERKLRKKSIFGFRNCLGRECCK